MPNMLGRKIVVFNQASNYLTIGLCNSFLEEFDEVVLITGSVHVQGENLNPLIKVVKINHWVERPASKKLWSYIVAIWKIFWLLKLKFKKHEVFFVSLPPMGYLLNLLVSNRFSVLIWDVYPDVFKITGLKDNSLLIRLLSWLNRISLKKSYKIFTIGERMAELLTKYVDQKRIIVQPIWSIFQTPEKVEKANNPFIINNKLEGKFIVQYSGNIGLTHKVELMVELAEQLKDNSKILFQIIGRGPRVPFLKKLVEEKRLPNCMFLPFQTDDMFPFSLSAADLGVVILDELTAKGSVPSKSYNLMSYGIPSLYIASLDSELNTYAHKYEHAVCFNEDSLKKAAEFIEDLSENMEQYRKLSQNALIAAEKFKRKNANQFVEKYLS
jgi:hypothetical protein